MSIIAPKAQIIAEKYFKRQASGDVYYTTSHIMTIENFIEIEIDERENYSMAQLKKWQKIYCFDNDAECIWVCEDEQIALDYQLTASEREDGLHAEGEADRIKKSDGFIIPESDDGDGGYLFIYKNSKRGKQMKGIGASTNQTSGLSKIAEGLMKKSDEERYKSDEDIAAEFSDMKIEEIKISTKKKAYGGNDTLYKLMPYGEIQINKVSRDGKRCSFTSADIHNGNNIGVATLWNNAYWVADQWGGDAVKVFEKTALKEESHRK